MAEKQKLFVSYSHADKSICKEITAALEAEGKLTIWFDESLVPGEEYRKKIASRIREADYVTVLLSGRSVKSEWVLDEVEYAKSCKKRIIPVWIEPLELPPDFEMILQRYHGLFWHMKASAASFARDFSAIVLNKNQSEEWHSDADEIRREMVPDEENRIATLMQQAAAQQYSLCYQPENALLLGRAYYYGIHTDADFEKARFFFKVASYRQNADAAFFLEQLKLDELREEMNDDEPSPLWEAPLARIEALAGEGSVPARLFMGNVYWYGKFGYPVDAVRSAQLYESCAREGNARAQYIMASNYYHGDGVPMDLDLAIMYAHLCLEQKYFKAWRRMGIFCLEGRALPQDTQRALALFTEGSKAGDYYCYCLLGKMYEQGTGIPKDPEKALSCYLEAEKAPINGQVYALRKTKEALGRFYESHPDIPHHLHKAAEKYLEGIQLGNAACREPYLRLRPLTEN